MNTTEVGFIVDGRSHKIAVLDAPTLTATCVNLMIAARVDLSFHFGLLVPVGNKPMRELQRGEAVVLDPAGTTAFMSWPQGIMNG